MSSLLYEYQKYINFINSLFKILCAVLNWLNLVFVLLLLLFVIVAFVGIFVIVVVVVADGDGGDD